MANLGNARDEAKPGGCCNSACLGRMSGTRDHREDLKLNRFVKFCRFSISSGLTEQNTF